MTQGVQGTVLMLWRGQGRGLRWKPETKPLRRNHCTGGLSMPWAKTNANLALIQKHSKGTSRGSSCYGMKTVAETSLNTILNTTQDSTLSIYCAISSSLQLSLRNSLRYIDCHIFMSATPKTHWLDTGDDMRWQKRRHHPPITCTPPANHLCDTGVTVINAQFLSMCNAGPMQVQVLETDSPRKFKLRIGVPHRLARSSGSRLGQSGAVPHQ
jgi:hypothetical protein